MTRARKRLILTWARFRRRFGGGEQERSTPSCFLSEVPEQLTLNLGPDERPGEVGLTAERFDMRQAARRNTYTGKTYNSVGNISQFFAERGLPFQARGTEPSPRPPAPGAPVSRPPMLPPIPARPPATPKPPTVTPAPVRRVARAGTVVQHPKYGTGTVVRREGDGEDAKITVNFPRFGLKKLVEKYAGLKRD